MTRPSRFISTICVLLAMLILCSCAPVSVEAKGYTANVIRINYYTSYNFVIPYVIYLRGLMDDKLPEGVTVEWSSMPNTTEVRDALVANQLDIAPADISAIISSVENGLPISILAKSASARGFLYTNKPGIKSLSDIQPNQKIAVPNLWSSSRFLFMLLCKEQMGSYNHFDDNMVSVSTSEMVTTLTTTDAIDCAVMNFPLSIEADKLDNLEMIYDFTPIKQQYQLGSLCVGSKEFVENNPVLADAYLEAAREAMEYMNESPAEAAQLLSEGFGIEAAEIEKEIRASALSQEISESAYDELANFMHEIGVLENPPKKFSELPNYDSIPKIP